MPFCSKCGAQLDDGAKFCSICGAVQEPAAPTYTAPTAAPQQPVYTAPQQPVYTAPQQPVYTAPQQPVYTAPQQPVYTAPQQVYTPVNSEPQVSTGSKVGGFVGMGLSIGALVLSIIGIIYMLPFLSMNSAYYDGYAFGLAIGFGIFTFPLSIVGRSLCGKSARSGNTSKACSVGSGLGLAGLILSIVMLFLGFVSLAGAM